MYVPHEPKPDVVSFEQALAMQRTAEPAKVIVSGGRKYVALQVQQTIKPTFFQALGSAFSSGEIGKLREIGIEHHVVKTVLVRIKEEEINSVALRLLLPELTSDVDNEYIWPREMAVGEFSFPEAIAELAEKGELIPIIAKRQDEIQRKRDHFLPKIEQLTQEIHLRDTYSELEADVKGGDLTRMEGGQGGAYLLKDENGSPRFIVKPNDEDILCLNNRKKFASPFTSEERSVRPDIPTYESAQNEALSYQVAHIAGLSQVAPKTVLAVFQNDNFSVISDRPQFKEFSKLGGRLLSKPDEKMKLCSAQEFIPNSDDLVKYSIDKRGLQFNQEDFEKANIFTWITGDEDGHPGNYRVQISEGQDIRLKKIDNGLTFGSGQGPIVNGLENFDQIKSPLSPQGKQIVRNIDLKKITDQMRLFNKSEASMRAVIHRVALMQKMIDENENITLEELNEAIKNNYSGEPQVEL